MKRLGSSDSLGALITSEEQNPRNHVYGRDHQMMLEGIVLDEEGCSVEELGHHHHSEKKRRLSVDQVKALEKNFEVENKLEPERKVKLAQELGLQPRQVAVWFQNRRARWKTKQLERDYGVLKANYDALKLNHDILQQDNQALLKEIKDLKSRLQEKSEEEDESAVKEEISQPAEAECDEDHDQVKVIQTVLDNYECLNRNDVVLFSSDDSDTSAIVNEGNSPNNAGISTSSCLQFQKTSSYETTTQPQYVKMEEHNFFGADGEACNFFSEDQAPTLQWYWS